jgi:hypothetical protein
MWPTYSYYKLFISLKVNNSTHDLGLVSHIYILVLSLVRNKKPTWHDIRTEFYEILSLQESVGRGTRLCRKRLLDPHVCCKEIM